jgi:hypothetical protein
VTVYEFRREIEQSGVETLTVRADRADIAALLVLLRGRLLADAPPATPACTRTDLHHAEECTPEGAFRPYRCAACDASMEAVALDAKTGRCPECVSDGCFPLDAPS